jgi:ferritin-like metal-binding protein YciE
MQPKIVQYLNEAHATEVALIRDLQAQITIAPVGDLRTALEVHLRETRAHADRIERRLRALGADTNPIAAGVGLAQTVLAQLIALGKAPLGVLRGHGVEEKVLKNAKEACASEALEIATYTALERVARGLGDEETATLAAEIRGDEERMLASVQRVLPELADAVARAAGEPWPGYADLTVEQVRAALEGADENSLAAVREYERTHKRRAGVLDATGVSA